MAKVKKSDSTNAPVLRLQVAALPYRIAVSGNVEILVITSRDTGRFIIPKGWAKRGYKKPETAAMEAFEEAGIAGKVSPKPVGSYTYWKRGVGEFERLRVIVYPLRVTKQRTDWPEKGQRRIAWVSAADAALLVDEPELGSLIRAFSGVPR